MSADFKTPLGKIRGMGAAGHGTHHWWVHRLTAIANIPLSIFLVASIVSNITTGDAASYEVWHAWIAQPLVAVFVILFMINVAYHMWLGLQVVIEDYVHTPFTNITLKIALTFAVMLLEAFAVFSILKIAFGG